MSTSALTIIAAATLSISSPSNYFYTTPATSSLLGIGMGTQRSYAVPRLEDISFLREAYAERRKAIAHDYNPDSQWDFTPPGGAAVAQGMFTDYPGMGVDDLFTFWTLTFYGWCPATSLWEDRGWFVSTDFRTDDTLLLAATGPDYSVNGVSTYRTNGLAFFTQSTFAGDCIVPASSIRTNNYFAGALSIDRVCNAYHNLNLCGAVLGEHEDLRDRGHPTNAVVRLVADNGGEFDTRSSSVTEWETYTYNDYSRPEGQRERTASRASQAAVGALSTNYVAATERAVQFWSNWSITGWRQKEKSRHVATWTTQVDADGRSHITGKYLTSAYISLDWSMSPDNFPASGSASNRMIYTHYCLSTNAVLRRSLIDSVDLIAVFRIKTTLEESLHGNFEETRSTSTNHYFVAAVNAKNASYVGQRGGYYVYESSMDFGAFIRILWTQFSSIAGYRSINDSEIPDPSELTNVYSGLLPWGMYYDDVPVGYATLRRQFTMTIVDLYVYPLIKRRYNAEFSE